MAFTTLLGAIGAHNRAKHDASQEEEQRRQFDATLAERQTYDQGSLSLQQQEIEARNAAAAAAARAGGFDPKTGMPLPIVPLPRVPSMLSRYAAQVDPSTGKTVYDPQTHQASIDPQRESQRQLQLKSWYLQQAAATNDPQAKRQLTEMADAAQKTADSLALQTLRYSTVDVNRQGRIPLMQAQAEQAKARGTYYKQIIGVDMARIKAQLDAARGHDATRVQAAQVSAGGALQRAGISANSQIEGRLLAGYFALQGDDIRASTQRSIEAVRAAENYAAAQGKATGAFDQSLATPQGYSFPPISVTTGGDSGAGMLMGLLPLLLQNKGGVTPQQVSNAIQKALAGRGGAPGQTFKRETLISGVRHYKQQNLSAEQITTKMREQRVPEPQISDAIRAVFGTSNQPQAITTHF